MKQHISAGGILINKNNEIFMIRKIARDEWTLPKGTVEDGENILQTAIREVKEETGYAEIKPREEKPFSKTNWVIHQKTGEDIDKTVYFFIFYLLTDTHNNTKFMDAEGLEGAWFNIDDAINKAKFEEVKDILRKVQSLLH